MDFHLKQWRNQHESEVEEEQHHNPSGKIPKLLLHPSDDDDHHHHHHLHNNHNPSSATPALPLFADSTSTTRFPTTRMGSYFSLAQWQELELQALIYRYMLAGTSVPPELLHPIKKSLLLLQDTSPSYFLHHYPYQPSSLMQGGYWGRAAMDPEPGRCRRTDGKKWRCSRDVVVGQKYCERHVHRGRNRSRKPVEITAAAAASGGVTAFNSGSAIPIRGNGSVTGFSRPAASIDLFHSNQRTETFLQSEATTNSRSDGHVLRHFFDDWPRDSDDGSGNNGNPMNTTTCLSISTPAASDVSLKLSTGNDGGEEDARGGPRGESAQAHMNWAAGWAANQVASMGGPLAEALRSSSSSNPFPASVLHQVPRGGSAAETSYVSA
ncbi:Growth-regulating factor 4 [Linum perenne]